jgi:hypothetical protein
MHFFIFSVEHKIKSYIHVRQSPNRVSSFPALKYMERGYNIQYWNDLPKGGHVAVLKQPVFASDLKGFAKSILGI